MYVLDRITAYFCCIQWQCVCHPVHLHGWTLDLSSAAFCCLFIAHCGWLCIQHQYYWSFQRCSYSNLDL